MDLQTCNDLLEREDRLYTQMRLFIVETLQRHGGRVTFRHPGYGGEWTADSIVCTLYGERDNPNIDLTSVWLGEHDDIYADGINSDTDELEEWFPVYDEQLSFVLRFVREALAAATDGQDITDDPPCLQIQNDSDRENGNSDSSSASNNV